MLEESGEKSLDQACSLLEKLAGQFDDKDPNSLVLKEVALAVHFVHQGYYHEFRKFVADFHRPLNDDEIRRFKAMGLDFDDQEE